MSKNKNIKNDSLVINIIGTLIILFLFIGAVFAIMNVNTFGMGNNIFGKNTPTNQKNKNQKYNRKIPETITTLIVGRGGVRNDAPNLTDTIIVAKLNRIKKTVSLLSIPRDIYVTFPEKGAGKINSIYATFLYRTKNKNTAMNILTKKIEDITGETIDYYINVDFNGFTKIIDALGGIEVEVEKRLVDNEYPNDNWGYQTVIFKKGKQTLNGARALMFARSRKSTSDFDRSLRQQKILKAIKNKILSDYKLQTVKDITNIYSIFKENIFTNASLKDIIQIILHMGFLQSDFDFYSSNINDSCFSGSTICKKGGIVYVPKRSLFGGMSVELFNGTNISSLSNYKLVNRYSNLVLNYPKVSKENYDINIFNSTKYNNLAYSLVNKIKSYGFRIPSKDYVGNTKENYEKTLIYFNNIEENSDTMQALKTLFDGEFIKTEVPKYSKSGAKIEIILGNDYIKNKKILKF